MNNLALQQKELVDTVFTDKQVSREVFRANVQKLENMLKDVPGYTKRYDAPLKYNHYFTPGQYAREITIPERFLLTTGIHATEHIAIISKGKCMIATEDGLQIVEAPHTMITKIGTKRAIYVIEEVVWTTIHAIAATTEEEAIEQIEFKSWDDYHLRGIE